MMALPKTKQDELWRLGETVGHDRVLESLLDQNYPEKKDALLKLSQEQGADRVLESLLVEMLKSEDLGKIPGAAFERERPPVFPTAQVSKQAQPIAEGRIEEPSVFERLEQMEEFEAAGRTQAGEAIVGEVVGFGKHLAEETKQFLKQYSATKRTLIDKPLAKLQKAEREAIRKGMVKMRKAAVYLPTIDETKELIEARNWKALNELAEDGRLPTAEELGTDYVQQQASLIGQEGDTVKARAQLKILNYLANDPSASWLRRGEIPQLVPAEFIAKHPKLSLAPLILTAPVEEVARIAATPTEWDEMVLYYTAGRMVLQPATVAGARYLSTKGWATKPITPLKSLGRKFPKKQPVSVADIQAILKADPDVGDDVLRAFTQLSNAEKADIARAVKAGKPVHIATPRFGGGEPTLGQPTPERLGFGITPEQRPFYPPVPTTGQPTAPTPTPTPTGIPIYGVQENLPIPFEGVPVSAADVPATGVIGTGLPVDFGEELAALPAIEREAFAPPEIAGLKRPPVERPEFFPPVPVPEPQAIPLDVRTGLAGISFEERMPRKPVAGLLPPPATPSRLLTTVSDPATQERTGLTPDMVSILRRSGLTDAQITGLVGASQVLPEGVQPAEAAPLPKVAPEPTAEAIPLEPSPAIPLTAPEPVAEAAEMPDVIAEEKPVRVIPKRSKVKKGKISVLPDKARVLAEIDAAVKKAPKRNDLDAIRRAIVGQETTKLADIVKTTDLEETRVLGFLRQLEDAGEIQRERQNYRATDKLATPEAGGGKLTFKMDGGTIQVQNNKEALSQVRKLVSKVPLTMDAPGVEKTPSGARGGISPNREQVDDLVKGAPEGYFTDGKIIVKGKPPKSAKFDPVERDI
jgi:hypothetical protein